MASLSHVLELELSVYASLSLSEDSKFTMTGLTVNLLSLLDIVYKRTGSVKIIQNDLIIFWPITFGNSA